MRFARAWISRPRPATTRRLGGPGLQGVLGRPGAALALATLALLAAGCQVPWASSGSAPGSQQITVVVVPGFANAPLQVAIRDGLFARNRLDVTVQDRKSVV